MYIDEKVLKVIFRANDDKKFEEIMSTYNEKISDIALQVYIKYFNNINIEKPALKGLKEFEELDIDNLDPNNKNDQKKVLETTSRAFMAAATTPEFQKMYWKTVEKFHEFLVSDSIEMLEEEELDELIDHIKKVKSNLQENAKTLKRILEENQDRIAEKHLEQIKN